MDKEDTILLIKLLANTEFELPDDKWDEHHWKGFKAGIIASINKLTYSSFNYNCSAKEIFENLKRRI